MRIPILKRAQKQLRKFSGFQRLVLAWLLVSLPAAYFAVRVNPSGIGLFVLLVIVAAAMCVIQLW